MNEPALLLFAFLAGLTLSGLAGAVLELIFRRPVSLGAPFVSSNRVLRSLGVTLLAGPMMLTNEALGAWRMVSIGPMTFAACVAVAGLWAFAAGILIVELAFFLTRLVG